MVFSGKVYDALKALAQVWLPAAGTLYFALAQIWHLPDAEQVTGTVVAVDTFLGVILKISSVSYNKSDAKYDGSMDVILNPDGTKTMSLSLNADPAVFETLPHVLFKVNAPETPPAPENKTDPRLLN